MFYLRRRRRPLGKPVVDLLFGNLKGNGSSGDINGDEISILDNGDGAALHGFRGNVADGCTPGSARKPTIGNQRNVCIEAHARDGGRGGQHLLHARATLGAFVSDHQNVAFLNFTVHNSLADRLFGIEYPGGSFVPAHFIQYGRLLDHASLGREIAEKSGQTALGVIGVVHGADDISVHNLNGFDIFSHRFSGDRHAIFVNHTGAGEFLDHGLNAAGSVQFFDVVKAARTHGTEMRGDFADLVNEVEIKVDFRLIGQGGEMQRGIG